MEATTITIEVNVCTGVNFILVGLPDSAVKESQQRVKAAVKSIGLKFPGKEITVNMAPADIHKEGSTFDVPIAIGILAASEQLNQNKLDLFIILGELSLDGHIQAMKGILPIAIHNWIIDPVPLHFSYYRLITTRSTLFLLNDESPSSSNRMPPSF